MAHQRKLIRDAVIATLKAGSTAAGQRVFGNRARMILKNELPAILVYTRNEPVEISAESPREFKRSLALSIELIASADDEDTLDDVLDDLAEEVENLLFVDETQGGVATDTILGETEIETAADGEKPVGMAKITLTLPYFQRLPADLTGDLDAFETAHTEMDPAPADAVAHANSEDDIELPQ